MYKYLILVLLLVSVAVDAQDSLTYISVDSITSRNYENGEWDQLIKAGKEAVEQNIDYKILRQRMGYAYFVKAEYYAAQKQYEKALVFDEYDPDIRIKLYYCGLNTGNEMYARYQAGKLPVEQQRNLNRKSFRIVDAMDAEYNYKINDNITRSNPTYIRLGISSQPDYRLSLYQSVSNYTQTVDNKLTKQPDYYALLKGSLNAHTSILMAYHYLNTRVDTIAYPANMLFGAITTNKNRFHFGLNSSILSSKLDTCIQIGLQAGVKLPGKANIYLNSSLIGMIEPDNYRFVFSQTAGLRICKVLWAEANLTLGNLKNYHDYNGLYIYNALDPTIFRTGLTLYGMLSKDISIIGNYTYDTKRIDLTGTNYNQHSFSGGIIWKI